MSFILKYISRLSLTLCLLLLSFWPCAVGAAGVPQEYKLKAAYLFNFARFISYPDEAIVQNQGILNFCVIGPNPFASLLSKVESKRVQNYQLKVHYLQRSSDLQQCHIAFYTDLSVSDLKTLDFENDDSLTVNVSDTPGFVDSGGDIEFVVKHERLQFIINNSSLISKGLQPRASLLELAAEVR